MNTPKLKVIIADRSHYLRLVLANMMQNQPDLEVLDTVSDSVSLMETVRHHRPDVLLADLGGMTRESRLRLLQRLHQEVHVPVLVVLEPENASAVAFREGAELGVYDYVLKPVHKLLPPLQTMQVEILDKIRAARQFTAFPSFSEPNATVFPAKSTNSTYVQVGIPAALVVVGASTGGTQAIEKIVAELDPELPACVLVAVHLPAAFTRTFARRLQKLTTLKVVEGRLGTQLLKGKIIIAPGNRNMIVYPSKKPTEPLKIGFEAIEPDEYNQPSVDLLMESVAMVGGRKVLGIVLTGMGTDGTKGLKAIKLNGGVTLVQDQFSSLIFGMARSAIASGLVMNVCPLSQIPGFINQFVADTAASTMRLGAGIQ